MAFSSRPSSKIYDKNLIFYHITAYCELIWQIKKSASSPPKYLRFSGCNDLWIFHIAKLTSKSAFSRKFQLLEQTLWVGIKLVFLSARRLFSFQTIAHGIWDINISFNSCLVFPSTKASSPHSDSSTIF